MGNYKTEARGETEISNSGISILVLTSPNHHSPDGKPPIPEVILNRLKGNVTRTDVRNLDDLRLEEDRPQTVYDGVILLCHTVQEAVNLQQQSMRFQNLPMLIMIDEILTGETEILESLLDDRNDTVYDLITTGELRTYKLTGFIHTIAYSKLVPNGSKKVW